MSPWRDAPIPIGSILYNFAVLRRSGPRGNRCCRFNSARNHSAVAQPMAGPSVSSKEFPLRRWLCRRNIRPPADSPQPSTRRKIRYVGTFAPATGTATQHDPSRKIDSLSGVQLTTQSSFSATRIKARQSLCGLLSNRSAASSVVRSAQLQNRGGAQRDQPPRFFARQSALSLSIVRIFHFTPRGPCY